jgi:hypothetical protein
MELLIRAVGIALLLAILGLFGCGDPIPETGGTGSDPPGLGDKEPEKSHPDPFQEDSPARKTLEWLPILGILGLSLSVIAFWKWPQLGVYGIAAFSVMTVTSLGLMSFAWHMAVIGGVVVLLAIIAISIIYFKTLKQIVQTGEVAKKALRDKGADDVYFKDGKADQIQSPQTKSLVEKIRKKLLPG